MENIDIAPTIAHILGVTPDRTVKGTRVDEELPRHQ
jgi:hypothetical protein